MSKLLYLDLETTGLYPWKNAVVQISGEVEIDGETKEKFNLLVKPFDGAVIEDSALKVNGRTREELETFTCAKEIFREFRAMLERYVNKWSKTDKFFMVGYNSHSFDSQFLREFFKKNGEKYYGSYFWSAGHDVMLLAAYKLAEERHKMKDFKLLTVARQLGIEVDETRLHDAEYDIEITKAMYKEVIK